MAIELPLDCVLVVVFSIVYFTIVFCCIIIIIIILVCVYNVCAYLVFYSETSVLKKTLCVLLTCILLTDLFSTLHNKQLQMRCKLSNTFYIAFANHKSNHSLSNSMVMAEKGGLHRIWSGQVMIGDPHLNNVRHCSQQIV